MGWKKNYLYWVGVGVVLLLGGCSYKTSTDNIYLTIKTPKYRLSDQGFLNISPNQKELIIYKEFTPYKITIGKREICESGKCLSKGAFLKKVGLSDYPPETLDLILEGKPLPFLPSPEGNSTTFIQKNSRFYYQVTKTKIFFRDKKERVLISLRKLSPPRGKE
ncbi:MAG: hypothetical protein C6I01_04535 [Epsilonproteobacteria bacterium]|nr:hypothetical protein [Campylobacterota bacterium]NPA89457.1 hypothetical protein [Campylobacterota bacterium]